MRLLLAAVCAIASVVFGAQAKAQMTNVSVIRVDNSSVLTGYVTNDIRIDFDGQYTGSQLLPKLANGTSYDADSRFLPTPIDSIPPRTPFYATAVLGELGIGGSFGAFPAGGAAGLGGDPVFVFDEKAINQTWISAADGLHDQTDYLLARVALSEDAEGSVKYLASANGEISQFFSQILDGVIVVPVPTRLMLLGVGVVGFTGF